MRDARHRKSMNGDSKHDSPRGTRPTHRPGDASAIPGSTRGSQGARHDPPTFSALMARFFYLVEELTNDESVGHEFPFLDSASFLVSLFEIDFCAINAKRCWCYQSQQESMC